MTIPSYDNTSLFNNTAAGTSVTCSHTIGSGDDRIVIAIPQWGIAFPSGSSATFGGAAMTFVKSSTSGTRSTALFYLVNPPTGASNAVVSWTGSDATTSLNVVSYKGVNQTTPFGTVSETTGSGGTMSLSVVGGSDNLILDFSREAATSSAFGSGQTTVYNNATGKAAAHSYKAGSGTVTMTQTTSSVWMYIVIPMNPSVVSSTGNFFTFFR